MRLRTRVPSSRPTPRATARATTTVLSAVLLAGALTLTTDRSSASTASVAPAPLAALALPSTAPPSASLDALVAPQPRPTGATRTPLDAVVERLDAVAARSRQDRRSAEIAQYGRIGSDVAARVAAEQAAQAAQAAAREAAAQAAAQAAAAKAQARAAQAAAQAQTRRAVSTPQRSTPSTSSSASPASSSSSSASPASSSSSSASGAGGSWAALRRCESGGNYAADTGNGYYGAYQFSAGTWHALGYSGLPSDASASAQDAAAQTLQAQAGWGQWPSCARQLGLL